MLYVKYRHRVETLLSRAFSKIPAVQVFQVKVTSSDEESSHMNGSKQEADAQHKGSGELE